MLNKDNQVKTSHVFIYILFFSLQLMYVYPLRVGIFAITSGFYTYITVLLSVFFIIFVLAFRKINYVLISWLLLFLVFTVSVIINGKFYGENLHGLIRKFYRPLGLIFFVQMHKKTLKAELKAIYIAAGILVILNAVTIILFPDGIFVGDNGAKVWLIGQKQEFVSVFMVTYVLGFILQQEKRLKKYIMLISIIMWASMLWTFPLGLMLSLLGMSFMMRISRSSLIYLKGKVLYSINLIGQLTAVIFTKIYNPAFGFYVLLNNISSLRGGGGMTKAQTLLQRIYMWQDCIDVLYRSPLFGTGDTLQYMHNQIFDLAYHCGWVAILIFVVLNIITFNNLDKYQGRNRDIIAVAIFAANILNLTECIGYYPYILMLYVFAFHIKEINNAFEQ